MIKSRIPPPEILWSRYEKSILEVLIGALGMLQQEKSLPMDENSINFNLYFLIRNTNHRLRQKGKGLLTIPLWEGQNQPSSEDDIDDARLRKKPDFQWQIVNDLEHDPNRAYRHYAIECKRLGNLATKTWNLNENYVKEGILRYIKKEYGYGENTPSGVMIGYIQSMELVDIFSEVNSFVSKESIAAMTHPINGWINGGVSDMKQQLDRPQVLPTPFNLHHLWVDLRSIYIVSNIVN